MILKDLIGCKIINQDKYYGEVIDIYENKNSTLLYIKDHKYYIPKDNNVENNLNKIYKERTGKK